jgi:effector-binding domain-containing protein
MDIELKDLPAQPTLCIRTRTSLDKLPQTIGEGYHKIAAYMEELGEKPVDVPFTAYYNMDMQDMDVEMGFPASKPLPGKGDIKTGKTMAGKAAVCMYKGSYSAMEKVYNERFKWSGEKGCQPKGACYEYYYNSPGEVPESELLTRIVIPVK